MNEMIIEIGKFIVTEGHCVPDKFKVNEVNNVICKIMVKRVIENMNACKTRVNVQCDFLITVIGGQTQKCKEKEFIVSWALSDQAVDSSSHA